MAKTKAAEVVARFVKKTSWIKAGHLLWPAPLIKKYLRGIQSGLLYLLKKISDVEKQKLYVFLTLGGDYIAANHTGK